MDLRVVDHARTVTYVPRIWPPAPDADLFAEVRDLLRHAPHQGSSRGQVEIVCDREFLQHLDRWAVDHGETSFASEHKGEMRPEFDGCPIIITDDRP